MRNSLGQRYVIPGENEKSGDNNMKYLDKNRNMNVRDNDT